MRLVYSQRRDIVVAEQATVKHPGKSGLPRHSQARLLLLPALSPLASESANRLVSEMGDCTLSPTLDLLWSEKSYDASACMIAL